MHLFQACPQSLQFSTLPLRDAGPSLMFHLLFFLIAKKQGIIFVGDAYHNKGLLRGEGKRRKSVNNKGFGKPDSRLLPSLRCPLKPSNLGMPVPASWRWLVAFSGMQSVRMLLFLSFVTPPFS